MTRQQSRDLKDYGCLVSDGKLKQRIHVLGCTEVKSLAEEVGK